MRSEREFEMNCYNCEDGTVDYYGKPLKNDGSDTLVMECVELGHYEAAMNARWLKWGAIYGDKMTTVTVEGDALRLYSGSIEELNRCHPGLGSRILYAALAPDRASE